MMRFLNLYMPFGILEVKTVFQYNAWFWVEMLRSIIAMLIMTAFWKAIYADQSSIEGLTLTVTLNYVILARALGNANASSVFWWVASHISKGELELQLLRPVDFQLMHLFRDATGWAMNLVRSMPALLIAILFFEAKLPSDPLAYLAFIITFVLGGIVLFFLEFMFGCLGFYTTEVWGLGILREGIALFFSGALIPLNLMPEAIRAFASLTPFAQALYIPISFISGVQSPSQLGNAILTQVCSIIVLGVLSRILFTRAARVLTVQGG